MDKDLKDDLEAFKEAADAEADQRKESLEQLKFARLGEQWPDDVKNQRNIDKRPCLTLNDCPAFAKQVINDARQNRPSIAVHPVGNGAEKETAEIYQGLIRNIQNISRADIVYDTALEFAVYMGFGYMVVRTDYAYEDTFDQDILIERVGNPFAVYGDPHSVEADSSDWNSAFIVDTLSKEAFKKRWPGAKAQSFETEKDNHLAQLWYPEDGIQWAERWVREETQSKLLKLSDGTLIFEDDYNEPDNKAYFDGQMLTVTGDRMTKSHKVTQRIITGAEILETNEWKGKYIPIVPVYGDEVNIEGKRYFHGLFRHAMDAARMRNYWRTTSTELVALAPKAPYIGPVGAFVTDAAKWQTANTANYPYIEFDVVPEAPGGGAPERQAFAGVPAGALQEALNAADDMKRIIGLHDASLGARSNETSGRAILARQREGDVSTFNFMDNLGRGIEHLGRIIVDLTPHVYTAPRIIRCVKEDGTSYSVPINQPVMPKGQPMQGQQGPMQPGMPAPGMQPPGMPPPDQNQRMPGEPQEEFEPVAEHIEGLTKIFDLTTGKYDVTVTAGPSFTTRRQESSEAMMEFIRVLPQAGAVTADLVAKAQDWPGADEFAARLKAVMPPPIQNMGQNPQVQAMGQQMQQMDMHAKQAVGQLSQQLQQMQQELQAAKQAAADKTAENQLKAQELAIKDKEAETKRLQVILDTQNQEKDRQAKALESANAAIGQQNAANAANMVNAPPDHAPVLAAALDGFTQALSSMRQPRKVVRDGQGNMTGLE